MLSWSSTPLAVQIDMTASLLHICRLTCNHLCFTDLRCRMAWRQYIIIIENLIICALWMCLKCCNVCPTIRKNCLVNRNTHLCQFVLHCYWDSVDVVTTTHSHWQSHHYRLMNFSFYHLLYDYNVYCTIPTVR